MMIIYPKLWNPCSPTITKKFPMHRNLSAKFKPCGGSSNMYLVRKAKCARAEVNNKILDDRQEIYSHLSIGQPGDRWDFMIQNWGPQGPVRVNLTNACSFMAEKRQNFIGCFKNRTSTVLFFSNFKIK